MMNALGKYLFLLLSSNSINVEFQRLSENENSFFNE